MAPRNPAFTAMYNLAGIPNEPGTRPLNSGSPPSCPSIYSCSWTCNERCLGPDDIASCLNYNDLGLTYDDGPTSFTPRVLDMLSEYNIKATFFVIGAQVARFPDVLKRAYDSGHHIGMLL